MSEPPANVAEIEPTGLGCPSATAPRAFPSPSTPPTRLKLDLATSYALSIARVASNVAIFAILYRYTSEKYAATYALIRSMLMLLTYVFGGFNPALQRLLAEAEKLVKPAMDAQPESNLKLQYEPAIRYSLASALVVLFGGVAWFAVDAYARRLPDFHELAISRTDAAREFAILFGTGLLIRLASEPFSAAIQHRGRLWLDNCVLIAGEVVWMFASFYFINYIYTKTITEIGRSYAWVGLVVFAVRYLLARRAIGIDMGPGFLALRPRFLATFVGLSTLISLGQFADFLYAPANILLINTYISPAAVARYAPALQIDAGLLLLVGAVSTVMLPRAMQAFAKGQHEQLRDAYIRSTLACLFVLASASILVAILIEPILRLWLGTVPDDTATITRLVLIHTVIGGTAGVGRAVLLGMGRFKAYSLSALVGGMANVSLALLFVLVFNWGVTGIVMATILSVTVRCAIWMPWYILRTLREQVDS